MQVDLILCAFPHNRQAFTAGRGKALYSTEIEFLKFPTTIWQDHRKFDYPQQTSGSAAHRKSLFRKGLDHGNQCAYEDSGDPRRIQGSAAQE
jgi:hypothetical protein